MGQHLLPCNEASQCSKSQRSVRVNHLGCCRYLNDTQRQQEGAQDLKASLDAQMAAVRNRQAAEHEQEVRDVGRMQQHWAKLQVSRKKKHCSCFSG
jgi:hypothetical protein